MNIKNRTIIDLPVLHCIIKTIIKYSYQIWSKFDYKWCDIQHRRKIYLAKEKLALWNIEKRKLENDKTAKNCRRNHFIKTLLNNGIPTKKGEYAVNKTSNLSKLQIKERTFRLRLRKTSVKYFWYILAQKNIDQNSAIRRFRFNVFQTIHSFQIYAIKSHFLQIYNISNLFYQVNELYCLPASWELRYCSYLCCVNVCFFFVFRQDE